MCCYSLRLATCDLNKYTSKNQHCTSLYTTTSLNCQKIQQFDCPLALDPAEVDFNQIWVTSCSEPCWKTGLAAFNRSSYTSAAFACTSFSNSAESAAISLAKCTIPFPMVSDTDFEDLSLLYINLLSLIGTWTMKVILYVIWSYDIIIMYDLVCLEWLNYRCSKPFTCHFIALPDEAWSAHSLTGPRKWCKTITLF